MKFTLNIFLLFILIFGLLNNTNAQVWYQQSDNSDIITITDIQDEYIENNEISFFKDWKTPIKYNSLDELLKNENNVKSVTDGCNNWFITDNWNAAMTMMYCDEIYGKNWKELWERTDTKMIIFWDNVNYFKEDLFKKLYKNKTLNNKLNELLKNKSNEKILLIIERIDILIENTKMTRIAKFIQDKKITELLFIKEKLNEFLLK